MRALFKYLLLMISLMLPLAAWADGTSAWEADSAMVAGALQSADEAGATSGAAADEDIDVQSIIFEHIGDSYSWHLLTWGEKHISIPLPVIVHSKATGWHVFMSSKLNHGAEYQGFIISESEENEGKIVEIGPSGEEVRPFDISITKNVASLMISSAILLCLILCSAGWYRKHDALKEAPTGVAAVIEPVVSMINDDVIKDIIGPGYEKYSPYLLTVFFFILINNVMGIVPFFPGGANVTGNIAVTFALAVGTFLAVNWTGNKHYWKDIFWPDVPLVLKPILMVIEVFGVFTKPFALMLRLFANIMAGHSLILSIVTLIFITAKMGALIGGSMTFVSVVFGIFMDCLEILVAFIQAYLFTMLSAVFIGLSHARPEHTEGELR